MLKQYYLKRTWESDGQTTTEHWFIGDTERDMFYEVTGSCTFDEAAAFLKSKEGKLNITMSEDYLQLLDAQEIKFAKGNNLNGCIS